MGKFGRISSLLSKSSKIKLSYKVSIENCLFVSKSLNKIKTKNWFAFYSDTHKYEISYSEKGMPKIKSFNTKSIGKEAVMYSATNME